MLGLLQHILQDTRAALRGFRRHPALPVTAILACALGVGATTAVFSVVDRILFRPLPYADGASLVSVGLTAPLDKHEFMFAGGYFDLRRHPGPLKNVTSFQAGLIPCDLTENQPERLACLRVESNFLETLGVPPALGRSFLSEEDIPNGPRVAMISYGLWRSRFGGDPHAIGRTIQLDGATAVVVGVLPRDFETPTRTRADIWLPLALDEARESAGRALRVFARLQTGRTAASARAEMEPYFQRSLEQVPPRFRKEVGLRVQPVRDRQYGEFRQASVALFGAVLAVLLIACANIANLLLARSLSRDRELAMRMALGASRARIAQMALVESSLLGIAGGVLGCGMAYALIRIFASLAPEGLAGISDASIDFRALAFTLLVSLGAGLAAGLAPALRTPSDGLMGAARTTRPLGSWLRWGLVSVQVAVSLVLLVSAGLLMRSLWRLENVNTGIDSGSVLAARFVLSPHKYADAARQLAFFTELEQRLRTMAGVESAAITDSLPPVGGTRGRPYSTIEIEGEPPIPEGTGGMVTWRYISPGYFRTMRIPIRSGRPFNEQDQGAGTYSIVLSESLARKMFGTANPLGRRILKGPNGEWFTVVGVAADVRNEGLEKQPAPEYYLVRKSVPDVTFRNQEPPVGWRGAHVIARTQIAPGLMASALRQVFEAMDPTLPVQVETLDQRLGGVKQRPRFNTIVLGAFASIGLLLAAVGMYGVLSFLVTQRNREIGIRLALGATPPKIVATVLRHAGAWVGLGLALGITGSYWATRGFQSMLFGVEPLDPLAVSGAVLILSVIAMLSTSGPARRASRVDPAITLRDE